MSYEKHTWETGEVITAEKLNNIENGIENNNLEIVVFTQEEAETWTADKTLEELQAAYEAGKYIVAALRNSQGATTFPLQSSLLSGNGIFMFVAYGGMLMSDYGENKIELNQTIIQYLPSGISVINQHNYVTKASLS